MSVNFKTAVPELFTIPEPVSTSKSILRKTLVSIPANENSTFSPLGGTTAITWNISSPTEIFNGGESYIKFTLKRPEVIGIAPLALAAALDNKLSFDRGGIHSLIKRVEVHSKSMGTQLSSDESYNLHYSVMSSIHQSPEQIKQFGYIYGDDVDAHGGVHDVSDSYFIEGTGVTLLSAGGGTLVTAVDSRFLEELSIGDILYYDFLATAPITGVVTAVLSDLTCVIAGSFTSGVVSTSLRVSKRRVNSTAATLPGYGESREYCVQIQNSVLLQNLPLLVMRGGITVTLHLDLGGNTLKVEKYDADTFATLATSYLNYEMHTPVFMCSMITPHADIRDEYIQQYNSPEGLLYYIPQYRYKRSVMPNNSAINGNVQHTIGARGARKIYAVLTDAILTGGNTAASWACDKFSTFLRYDIKQFYAQVGSHQFPIRPVSCDRESNEAFQHLMNVSQSQRVRFQRDEWITRSTNRIWNGTGKTGDIEKSFIMAVDLSRDNGGNSNLTGTDLSNVALDFVLAGATESPSSLGLPGQAQLHMFVEYDAYLKISDSNTVVMS